MFRDSIDLKQLQMAGKLQLTLVDHHVLSPENEFLRTSVVEIIDHHPQDPAWLWSQQKVALTTVGSCCTLVANEVLQRCPQLISHQVAALLYGECAVSSRVMGHICGHKGVCDHLNRWSWDFGLGQVCDGVICVGSVQLWPRNSELMEVVPWRWFLYMWKLVTLLHAGPIILDTACFSQAADRTTDLDLRMAAEMEARGVDPGGREKLFEELLAARCDVSHLTPSQLLVKDMKIASGVPVPGLPILVEVCFGCVFKKMFFFIACLLMLFDVNNCIFCMYSS